jgi:hypothetical protein
MTTNAHKPKAPLYGYDDFFQDFLMRLDENFSGRVSEALEKSLKASMRETFACVSATGDLPRLLTAIRQDAHWYVMHSFFRTLPRRPNTR